MRRRSFTGPLLLLLVGAFFLWRNLHPEAQMFDMVAQYWPFVLIAWGVLRLVEVLVWRGQGYYGSGMTGGEIVLVVLICLAGSGLWEAHRHYYRLYTNGLGEVFGEQFDYPLSAHGPATGMNWLTIENPRGNVKVTGADTQEITITGHKTIRAWSEQDAQKASGNTPVEIVPQGDRVLVRTNQDRAPEDLRISDDLEITVPRGMTVEARSTTGDYELSDLGGSVELTSERASNVRLARVNGTAKLNVGHSELIRASDVAGRLDIEGQGSDIDLENIAGQVSITGSYRGGLQFKNLAKPLEFEGSRNTELRVQAIPGRINMDLGQLTGSGITGPLKLVTQSRDIKLEDFTQGVELETERGDIELNPGKLPLPPIEARSGYGRIELVLPDNSTFDLDATAERGDAYNGFGSPIRQEREGRTATLKGKVGDGPQIRLVANRGLVAVRKEGTPSNLPHKLPKSPKSPRPPKVPTDLKGTEIKL